MFAARLVAYEPAGKRLAGALVDGVSWDASLPLNDVSALSLAYPDVVDPLGLSDAPVEIAVEVSDGGDWVEPRNSRFLSSEVQADLAAELDVPRYTFRGLGALLERPFVLRQSDNKSKPYTNDDDDPKRNFLSATAGQIITSVLQESRAKYPTMLQGIDLGFTASKDSLGNNWDKLDSVAYSPGTDLLRILEDMTARGICDWWMQGRTLMAANADSAAVKHDLRLTLLDVTESPLRATFENLASTVIVEGGAGKHWSQNVAGAKVPYGARVIRVANDAVTTDGTALDLIARQALQATSPRREYTRTIATVDLAPLLDFECGDWVWAKTGPDWEQVRVHELGLSYSHDDAVISARVTLNDRFVDAAVRDAKRLQGITHGTTQNLGSGGVPSRADKATPAAPKGVAANSLGYWQDAVPLSSVDVSWQAVTADTNGLALNGVDYYEVSCGGQRKRTATTSVGFDGLQPSRIHTVTVYAVSSTGIRGKTSSVEVLTAYPLAKLDPPTIPTLITSVGSLETRWDGKLKGTGAPYDPPKHFSHCLVEVQVEGTTEWVRYARDTGWSLVGQQTGKTYRVRLVAVDVLGNESAPSPEATIKIKSEVQEALDKANEVATEQLVQREKVNRALEKALAAEGGVEGALQGITNLDNDLRPKITAAQQAADSAVTDLTSIFDDVFIKGSGGSIRLRDSMITAPNIVASEALSAKIAEFLTVKASTIIGDNAAINTAFIDQMVGSDAFYDSVTTSRLVVAKKWWRITKSTGKASVSDSVVDATNTPQIRYSGGKAYIDDSGATSGANRGVSIVKGKAYLTAVGELGSTLLEPGSITTPMLVAQAVTAEKIKVGALDAFQITSPLIQSVSTANRGIKWTGSTFVAYNNSGAEMFRLDGNTGLIKGVNIEGATITGGTLRTAASGQRVVIQNNVLWAYSSNDTMYARLGIGYLEFYYNTLRASIGYSGYLNFYHPDGVTNAMQIGGPLGEIHSYDSDGTERIKLARSTGLTLWSSGTTPVRTEVNKNGIKNYQAEPGSTSSATLVSALNLPDGVLTYASLRGQSYFQVFSEIRAQYPTTTMSANINAASSSLSALRFTTSLRRAKADIQSVPNPVVESILDVPVRDWLDKGTLRRHEEARATLTNPDSPDEARKDAEMALREGLRRIPGVIAEEVMAAGLAEFCTYNEDGDLNGVMYDRLPLLLIPLVKDLRDRITDLERRLP